MKNKKNLTLNQTWTLCLRMWRWIAKVLQTPRYRRYDVCQLKGIWFRKNGFNPKMNPTTCFFCNYAINYCGSDEGVFDFCDACPGHLVDQKFTCSDRYYCYRYKPVKFYKELLRLNRIRKAKGNNSNKGNSCTD